MDHLGVILVLTSSHIGVTNRRVCLCKDRHSNAYELPSIRHTSLLVLLMVVIIEWNLTRERKYSDCNDDSTLSVIV